MEENDPPPPYTAAPQSTASVDNTYNSSSQYESVQNPLIHQPGTIVSSFTSVHSSRPTQADSIRGFVPPPHSGDLNTPPTAAVPQVQQSPAPTRVGGQTQAESVGLLTHQPGTSRSSFSNKPNIVIVPRQKQPPKTKPNIVIVPRQPQPSKNKPNIVIVPRQPQPPKNGPNIVIVPRQPQPSNSFVVDAPPSFNEVIGEVVHRFPRDFGFYHASGSFSDMVIAVSGDSTPLFYISTHAHGGLLSGKPKVVLHSNRYETSPFLATADFHSFSSAIDIDLMATLTDRASHHTLEKQGAFSSARVFAITLPNSSQRERFEWRRSQGAEVASLHGRGHGEKLVRLATGEIVAAFTTPHMSLTKQGKMSFLGNREALGEKLELMAVISILGIVEKDHARKSGAQAGAFGGGGAAAAAAGAAGAGC